MNATTDSGSPKNMKYTKHLKKNSLILIPFRFQRASKPALWNLCFLGQNPLAALEHVHPPRHIRANADQVTVMDKDRSSRPAACQQQQTRAACGEPFREMIP